MSDKIPCIIEIPNDEGTMIFQGLLSERPNMHVETIEIPYGYGHQVFHAQGRATWSNVELSFYEHYNSEEYEFLVEWIRGMADFITGRQGHAGNYKKNITVSSLDNDSGLIYNKWLLQGAFINSYKQDCHYDRYDEYEKIICNKLTRKVLFEKIGNHTMQIAMTVELTIDSAELLV